MKQSGPITVAGRAVQVMESDDPKLEPLLREVQQLKRRLDRVLNRTAHSRGELTAEDVRWAKQEGFDLVDRPPSGTGLYPSHFERLLTGGFRKTTRQPRQLASVPSWALIGWNRRRHIAASQAEAEMTMAELDEGTLGGHDGIADMLEPFGMVLCGEGKHRYELFADYEDRMLCNLTIEHYPDAEDIRARRVRGCPQMLHVAYHRPDGQVAEALLPFGDLSTRLLAVAGIEVEGWWIPRPWSLAVPGYPVPLMRQLDYCLHPAKLRAQILHSAYT